MIKHTREKQVKIVATGLALCMLAAPLSASAAESSVLMASGGVASVLETERTLEEYIQIAQDAQGASWGYTNIGVANVESGNLNVRAVSSTDGKLVGKLPKDAACEVVETVDDWAHIKSGEVEGYVSKEFLLTGPEARIRAMELVHTVATANTDGLNVRQEPNTTSEIVTQVGQGEEMEYVETGSDGWVKISIDGEDAYVSQDYVTVEEKLDTAITMTELLYGQGVSDVRAGSSSSAGETDAIVVCAAVAVACAAMFCDTVGVAWAAAGWDAVTVVCVDTGCSTPTASVSRICLSASVPCNSNRKRCVTSGYL